MSREAQRIILDKLNAAVVATLTRFSPDECFYCGRPRRSAERLCGLCEERRQRLLGVLVVEDPLTRPTPESPPALSFTPLGAVAQTREWVPHASDREPGEDG